MFDSYTLNQVEQFTLNTKESADYLAKKYFRQYGVFNYRTNNKGGRTKYEYKNVKVSEMRKALVWHLVNFTNLTLLDIADVVGVNDHSSVLYLKRAALKHFKAKDKLFETYYNSLLELLN